MIENPDSPRFTLRKSEKLRHRSLVNNLFTRGKSMYEWPLRIVWKSYSEEELAGNFRNNIPDMIAPLQMLITVPKRKRKHAVDRVLMRRRIRESYRLNRENLKAAAVAAPQIRTVSIGFVYLADKNVDYSLIEKKMSTLLNALKEKIENNK